MATETKPEQGQAAGSWHTALPWMASQPEGAGGAGVVSTPDLAHRCCYCREPFHPRDVKQCKRKAQYELRPDHPTHPAKSYCAYHYNKLVRRPAPQAEGREA